MFGHEDFVLAELIETGVIDAESIERARTLAHNRHCGVLEMLAELDVVSERDLAIVRAAISEYPYVDIEHYVVSFRNTALLPASIARRLRAYPLFDIDGVITLGMADPLDLVAVDQVRSIVRREIEPVLCEPGAIDRLIARAYSMSDGEADARAGASSDEGAHQAGEGPNVDAVNQIIAQAIEQGASDIHLGPDERELHLRYRIDGTLQRRQGPRLSTHPGLVQRLKVMANLDLTQTRRPQDGKFRFVHDGEAIDVRLSILPTVCGENVVLRLLSSAAGLSDFGDLGFAADTVERLERSLDAPHGIVLVSGPTGSGKTTTLYTALKRLNTPDRNVVTVEDPVEIRLPLIRQIQTNSEIGVTFASALRSILRHDPDVILVGEIRDSETASIALQASLTGHLVLSTLHTNDAPGAVTRLKDLGCPAFAINASLIGVVAQRLTRRLCASCAEPGEPEHALLDLFGCEGDMAKGFRLARGCPACLGTGYRARMALAEHMAVTPAIRRAIEGDDHAGALRAIALDEGMTPMWLDGLRKARLGHTTLEEIARIACASIAEDMGRIGDRRLRMSA